MIKEIKNAQEFDELTKKGNYIVDFFATWCGPCKMLAPNLHELDELGKLGSTNILKIDVDENRELSMRYQIQAVPTLFFMKDGQIIRKTAGYMTQDEILNFIK
mgnify:CR=1 FL=1